MSGNRAARSRRAIALVWLAAAAALLPLAPGVEERLEVSARILGSESAEVDRILEERFASPFARSALLVLAGIEQRRTGRKGGPCSTGSSGRSRSAQR